MQTVFFTRFALSSLYYSFLSFSLALEPNSMKSHKDEMIKRPHQLHRNVLKLFEVWGLLHTYIHSIVYFLRGERNRNQGDGGIRPNLSHIWCGRHAPTPSSTPSSSANFISLRSVRVAFPQKFLMSIMYFKAWLKCLKFHGKIQSKQDA